MGTSGETSFGSRISEAGKTRISEVGTLYLLVGGRHLHCSHCARSRCQFAITANSMSSLSRGTSGASKPKPVNVNSLYAGRNLSAGAKPLGKHGLTSVGKSVGVVRRMPPPATLPSLKAENNGQDPSTVVVPQGGTGWSKNDTSTDSSEVVKTSSLTTSSGPDLRPIWAKPPSEALSSGDSSTREFPTLAVAAQGIDVSHRSPNKWAVGENSHSSEQKTQVSTSEEAHALPSRYCNNASDSMGGSPHYHPSSERSRFQGSSDARVSHPNYSTSVLCRASQKHNDSGTNDVCAARDSAKVSVVRRDDDRVPQYSQTTRASEFFDGGAARDVHTEESYSVLEYDRDDAIGKSRHKRTSFRSLDGEDVDKGATDVNSSRRHVDDGIKRRTLIGIEKKLNLEDVSDEDDDIQMTKLDKPNVRVVKRVAEPNGVCSSENNDDSLQQSEAVVRPVSNDPPASNESSTEMKAEQFSNVTDCAFPSDSNAPDDGLLVSTPAENVWAKRQEERESQEREKHSQMPKVMQQAIEQHFPSVSEAAFIKVDKEAARRPADSDFTRATLRATRQQGSNDVRQLIYSEESFPRRTAPRGGQRSENYDNRGHSFTRMNQGEQQHLDQRDGNHLDSWDRGGRRQIPARGRCARTRGRTALLMQPQVLHRPSVNKKVEKETVVTSEEKIAETSLISESDMRVQEGKHQYGTAGEKPASTKPKTRHETMKASGAKLPQKQAESGALNEHDKNRDSGRTSPHRDEAMERRPTNRFSNKGFAQRGHARKGRGGNHSFKPDSEEFRSQRNNRGSDGGVSNAGGHAVSSLNQVKGKHDYQQQRSRRKFEFHQRSHSHMKSIGQDRADRLRSPVVSSEGYDEWETASESSTRVPKEELSDVAPGSGLSSSRQTNSGAASLAPNPVNAHQGGSRTASNQTGSLSESTSASNNVERSNGSKNAQPASRTCQSPCGSYSYKNNKESNSRNVTDALAGLDINNIASVVVIDDHLVDTVSVDTSEEFEEVLNKRARKQKALLMQAKMEAEEKRKMKDKERHFRTQGRRLTRQSANRKDFKKSEVKKDQKKDPESWTGTSEQKKPKQQERRKAGLQIIPETSTNSNTSGGVPVKETTETHTEVPITTVWNSAHIAGQKESIEGTPSVIPSPIARPNPRCKSAASDTPSSLQDLVRRQIVELPVSLSSSQPLRGDKYDFTFDPRLHEEQMSTEKVLPSLSTGASSEAGSMTDDFRLKEKLYKVKGLWSGEEKESDSNLPSNVAKVKPQPQSGVEHLQNDGKPAVNVPNGCHTVPPKSPGIAPFPSGLGGLMFSPYPVMFGDVSIGRGYTSIGSVVQPLIPPSNASSPPVGQPLYQQPPSVAATATMNQRQLQIRSNYMEQNPMFASNLQPSQNVAWNIGSMLDSAGSAALSGTPSPQLQPTHISSSVQPPPPNLIMQHRGPGQTTMAQNHSQSLAHGYGVGVSTLSGGHIGPPPPPPNVASPAALVPPPPIPPPEMMNIPPPIGSQRVAPMTVQYAGFPPPPLTHTVHPSHNFAHPPPNVRFAHPPPPPSQDSQWDKGLTRSYAGSRPQFAMFQSFEEHSWTISPSDGVVQPFCSIFILVLSSHILPGCCPVFRWKQFSKASLVEIGYH
ncbi:hypothetical protein Y032_0028g1819 [Ancylostoma ceylanicum]|uniref:BAT2 N-terminal domain-containing protein n=1 Tax=Ancylostoma ceylanicum TaxID=53326 RepID=A0A016USF4_9BILA|nr:hypothetical protein Y032_0028g1819 [Ancylostoma ceylanicum]